MLLTLLAMLKLGIYAPAQDAPLGMWFYGGINLVEAISHSEDRIGIEFGYTKEPVSESFAFGQNLIGRRLVFRDAVMMGVSYRYNKSLDVSGGIRQIDNRLLPYVSVGIKLGSLRLNHVGR